MAHRGARRTAFPNPFEVPIPPDCKGWEEMYAYHVPFSEDRRDFDEGRLWIQDGLHTAEPICPLEGAWLDCAVVALNQASTRLFAIPPSLGIEYRILNGYNYFSATTVTDEATLARRAELFAKRGGYYYEHWEELYAHWRDKVEAAVGELKELAVPDLPEFEDEAIVTEGRGLGSSYALLVAYDRLFEGLDRVWQYHFEFLNLGYGAYVVFCQLCRQAIPGISNQSIAKMASGIDVLVLRPDEELRRLAGLAIELGVADGVKGAVDEAKLKVALAGSDGGTRWLADFEQTKDPWFYFSHGNGIYHHHRSWIDDTTLPIATIGSYIRRLQAGEDISRPKAALTRERDRMTAECRALVPEETREAFDEQLALSRTVFAYVENHSFYIDHRYLTIYWNKVREFGALLARHEFLGDGEDVFYLRRDEVRAALEELRLFWSSGSVAAVRGPTYWPPLVARRKAIYEAMSAWAPPEALGPLPEDISEPITLMLHGVTMERVQEWLAPSDGPHADTLVGAPGSPGAAEGLARVILRADQLGELEDGEILVAPSLSPSWTTAFGTIAAVVLDTGGVMCHAAIVARECGLPAVVGTGSATKRIRTGDRLQVNADTGVVTIL
jgi:pyruvate,water dikinase